MLLRKITALFRLVLTLAAGTLRSPVLWAGPLIVVFGIALVGSDGGDVLAQEEEEVKGALMLIMDASSSMTQTDDNGTPLIQSAKEALGNVVEALPEGTPVGLTIYGSRVPDTTPREEGCRDVEVVAPVSPLDKEEMKSRVGGIEARGYTPIGRALQEAADALPPEGPRTIVLVSDGRDTCAPPPPCEVAQDLSEQGIDVKIETVGFFLEGKQEARGQLECIADATGGSYYDAGSAAELTERLETISTREARRFEAGGQQVTGAPIPQEAPTIEPGVTYIDEVLGTELNYYRLEVEPGQKLTVEAIREARPELYERTGNALSFYLSIVDRSTDPLDYDCCGAVEVNKPDIRRVEGLTVPEGVNELFIEIETEAYVEEADELFTAQLTATVTGGEPEETTVESPPPETTAQEDTSTEDATSGGSDNEGDESSGSPTSDTEQASASSSLMMFGLGILTMVVIGLAVALFVVLRRRA